MAELSRKARIQGMLFGLALGDALGEPVEFQFLTEIRAHYGAGGIQHPPNPAQITDDTALTIDLVQAILSAKDAGHSPQSEAFVDVVMQNFAQNLIATAQTPIFSRMGETTRKAIANLQAGTSWQNAGITQSKGCGAPMRVAPIGAFFQHDEKQLRQLAIVSSQVTHEHPTALASTVATAYLIKLALDDVPASQYLSQVMAFTDGMSDDLHYAFLRIGHALGWRSTDRALRHLGEGWIAEEAVAMALYCVLKHPDEYVAVVRCAANIDGDSDSVACIAGAIAGARLGISAIPQAWLQSLPQDMHQQLQQLADNIVNFDVS
jgi:ADP-ribosylglycohydrolase